MGDHEGWALPNGLLPNGLFPNEASSMTRALDSERWMKVEQKTAKLIACIQPNQPSEEHRNAVANYIHAVVLLPGNAILEKFDLEIALKALKDRLMTKNMAEEIAEKLCESVAASLERKKLGSFTRVSSTVQTAIEEALVRILTPRRSIDILRDVHAAKEQGKPYVVVFVGVNGVEKSTNLAKVAYWLLQHNINVMLAACDTFRSGTVEQLRTHARRLQLNPPPSEALRRIHMLACDPGIIGIMTKNQGEEISLRLRTNDLNEFRKDESIKKTLLHELAHMVHSEHDANFFALDKQLNHEVACLDWTKSKSYVLGGSNFSNHYDEETQFEETNYSGQRLGRGTQNLEANARESSASAAYRRFLSASTYSLEGSQPNPDGGGLDTKSNVIFKMNGSSPCSSRSSMHNNVEPDPDDSHDEEATVPPSQVCKAVQSFDKTDPDCDMVGDHDFSHNFNAIKPDAYGDGTTKRVKLSSPPLATKWAYGDGTMKRLKLSSQEVATKRILVSVWGKPDPDDQMDELVAAVYARLHKAIETLRFQVTPVEAASALHTLLRIVRLCWEKFGWDFQKADELLVHVLKEYNKYEGGYHHNLGNTVIMTLSAFWACTVRMLGFDTKC